MTRIFITAVFAAGLTLTAGTIIRVPPGGPCLAAQETASSNSASDSSQATSARSTLPTGYAAVAKIFDAYHCTLCHGGNEPRAGLSLDDYRRMMKGGRHGAVVAPGKPESSELIRRIKGQNEPRMPYGGPPWLSDNEVATVEQWISGGAKE